jgi:hypothetical protein
MSDFAGKSKTLTTEQVRADAEKQAKLITQICPFTGEELNVMVEPQMTNTKELIEELRVQANQHPCDADLLQFDIAATALEQLEARCAELERERAEVARKAYRQGFMDSGEGFNGELYQDGFSKVVSGYNQMEAEYIENIKEQAK